MTSNFDVSRNSSYCGDGDLRRNVKRYEDSRAKQKQRPCFFLISARLFVAHAKTVWQVLFQEHCQRCRPTAGSARYSVHMSSESPAGDARWDGPRFWLFSVTTEKTSEWSRSHVQKFVRTSRATALDGKSLHFAIRKNDAKFLGKTNCCAQ